MVREEPGKGMRGIWDEYEVFENMTKGDKCRRKTKHYSFSTDLKA